MATFDSLLIFAAIASLCAMACTYFADRGRTMAIDIDIERFCLRQEAKQEGLENDLMIQVVDWFLWELAHNPIAKSKLLGGYFVFKASKLLSSERVAELADFNNYDAVKVSAEMNAKRAAIIDKYLANAHRRFVVFHLLTPSGILLLTALLMYFAGRYASGQLSIFAEKNRLFKAVKSGIFAAGKLQLAAAHR